MSMKQMGWIIGFLVLAGGIAFGFQNCSGVGESKLSSVTATDTPVNGACGHSQGDTLFSAPEFSSCVEGSNCLCAAGVLEDTPSIAADSFSWTCLGTGGGTPQSCTASKSTITTNQLETTTAGIYFTDRYNINWSPAVTDATSYNIKITTAADPSTTVANLDTTTLNQTVTGLTVNTTYVATVTAQIFVDGNPKNISSSESIEFTPTENIINGECGSVNGRETLIQPKIWTCDAGTGCQCSSGAMADLLWHRDTFSYTWSCLGSGSTATNDSCSATLVRPTVSDRTETGFKISWPHVAGAGVALDPYYKIEVSNTNDYAVLVKEIAVAQSEAVGGSYTKDVTELASNIDHFVRIRVMRGANSVSTSTRVRALTCMAQDTKRGGSGGPVLDRAACISFCNNFKNTADNTSFVWACSLQDRATGLEENVLSGRCGEKAVKWGGGACSGTVHKLEYSAQEEVFKNDDSSSTSKATFQCIDTLGLPRVERVTTATTSCVSDI